MIDFLKKSVWSFSSIFIKSLCALATNKIFAVYFGTSGITLLAHFQNLISLVTQVPNDGVNRGIIKYWSSPQVSNPQKQKYFVAGLVLNFLALLASIMILYFFRGYFFRDFDFNFDLRVAGLLLAGISLYVLHLYLLSLILSIQKIRIYAMINAAGSIIVLLSIWLVAGRWNIMDTLIMYVLAQSAACALSILYVLYKRYVWSLRSGISIRDLGKLGEFMLMALSVLIFGKVTDFVIRDYAIQSFGMHSTGLWQALVKISDGYLMLFINTVGLIYYPQVSALILNTDQLRQYLRDVLKIVILVSISGLTLIYILRTPVLTLLYNAEFVTAGELMPMQFIGDFFCIISYLLTYIISAQARTRMFIILQAASAVFYIGLVFFITSGIGIAGIPIAHAIRYGTLAIILFLLNKRIIF